MSLIAYKCQQQYIASVATISSPFCISKLPVVWCGCTGMLPSMNLIDTLAHSPFHCLNACITIGHGGVPHDDAAQPQAIAPVCDDGVDGFQIEKCGASGIPPAAANCCWWQFLHQQQLTVAGGAIVAGSWTPARLLMSLPKQTLADTCRGGATDRSRKTLSCRQKLCVGRGLPSSVKNLTSCMWCM